jgi:hypothetical protein
MGAICQATGGFRGQLENILQEIIDSLGRISELMAEIYFSHALSSGPALSGSPEQSS